MIKSVLPSFQNARSVDSIRRYRASDWAYRLMVLWLSLVGIHGSAAERLEESTTTFLRQYCADCHTAGSAEAGFDISELQTSLSVDNFERWVRTIDRVEEQEMPPEDAESPTSAEREAFVRDTSRWLESFQHQQTVREGRVPARRLTNVQLERSLHALLGIDIPLATEMPDEPRTDGFTTVADGQSISHFQLQTHLNVVDKALEEAFRRATSEPDEWSREMTAEQIVRTNPRRRCREPELINGQAVVWSSTLVFYGRVPATTAKEDGWYRFRLNASALKSPKDHGVWCTVRTGPCVSSAPLLGWVGAFEATEQPREWVFETWLPKGHMIEVKPGDRTLKRARFAGGQVGAGEGGPQNVPGVAINRLIMERFHHGPDNDAVRERLFADLQVTPGTKKQRASIASDDLHRDITRLMTSFAQRAFRRSVAPSEIAHYLEALHAAIDDGQPLIDVVRDGYRALLCSPYFVYFDEAPGRLTQDAIASRLSYFLTGGPPDTTLRKLAQQERLRDRRVLMDQVDRLLAEGGDTKFIRDFAAEWLDLSEIDFTEPDPKLFGDFDTIVQQSMVAETETFLTDLLRHNRSVLSIIDSDYTFLDNRLARYYSLPDVDGDAIRKVDFPTGSHRGGLLTQGAILKVTANGSTTSPVIRGVWISERLLGREIPPPPQSVPAIEPDIRGATTIREMLAKHRSDVSCASCHVKIDPPGFALENFDPAGRWRDRYPRLEGRSVKKGAVIDAGYQLPNDQSFQDIDGFREIILQSPESIAANVASHLMVYGTGSPIRFSDRGAINAIVADAESNDFGFRSLLHAVVTSDLFLTK